MRRRLIENNGGVSDNLIQGFYFVKGPKIGYNGDEYLFHCNFDNQYEHDYRFRTSYNGCYIDEQYNTQIEINTYVFKSISTITIRVGNYPGLVIGLSGIQYDHEDEIRRNISSISNPNQNYSIGVYYIRYVSGANIIYYKNLYSMPVLQVDFKL